MDPTELVIKPGLTGIVGPNGCGKSNLFEALRWVMGESSHKSVRAAAMEDVIFSGSGWRPERQSAEVTMFIDNSARKAPAEFNGGDVIEITRRIERDAGSVYRINGHEVRARDVKVLFEDAATGTHSPALVRQGQIGEIVNSKPDQRRRILEDAAGIAGLHTRRHEAELKLKAAEANIERVYDVVGRLRSQIESLKRQVQQAQSYKKLSTKIQQQEALKLHLIWKEAQRSIEYEEAQLTNTSIRLGVATEAETKAFNYELCLGETLPLLRREEAVKAAALARFKTKQDDLERSAAHAAERARELEEHAKQIDSNLAREMDFVHEAKEMLVHLETDLTAIKNADRKAIEEEAAEKTRYETAEARQVEADTYFADITHRAAEAHAKLRSLEVALNERKDLIAKISRQITEFDTQITNLTAKTPDSEKVTAIVQRGQTLAQEISKIEADTLIAEESVKASQAEAKARRDEAQRVRLATNAFSTERETIAKLLARSDEAAYPPAIDYIRVSPGYETALGVALGDDLEAPIAPEASVHWRRLDLPAEDHALPADAEPLVMHVDAPQELTRRLRQIGVIRRTEGARLQSNLKPGQRLVSPEGDLWRWDGFVAAADGVLPAVQRLAHKNRLVELDRSAQAVLNEAKDRIETERAAVLAAQQAEAEEWRLRQLWREKQNELVQVRQQRAGFEKLQRERETRLAAVMAHRKRADEELTTAQARHIEIEALIVTMSEGEDLESLLETSQIVAQQARREVLDSRVLLGSRARDKQIRAERIHHSNAETTRWNGRRASAEAQVETLGAHLKEARDGIAATVDFLTKIAAQRETLLSILSRADEERREAADALAAAEASAKVATESLRSIQTEVSAAREANARIETRLENARQKRQEAARHIRGKFEVAPEDCLSLVGLPETSTIPALVDVERYLSKLEADRERLGGVNLQADDDLADVSKQLEGLTAERDDLEQGIAKLWQAIQQLNREGKSRLDDAFQTVNGHFKRLFTHLFSGGEAWLEMIESPGDLLEGGLEIIAKPPGKKTATLSLLSSGEQTLTALSLIFAVFLTNPSPICVLDEVDAPLDDANIGRFCCLMEQISAETETRFLAITHHPMTMARMNRLFGVTMAEKGVSQLVSVNLQTAQSFQEAYY